MPRNPLPDAHYTRRGRAAFFFAVRTPGPEPTQTHRGAGRTYPVSHCSNFGPTDTTPLARGKVGHAC
jgi:hypothetical protein